MKKSYQTLYFSGFLKVTFSSIQPPSSLHPQPHQYQGQLLSRGLGTSRNGRWLCLPSLSVSFADHSLLRKIHPPQEVLEAGIGAEGVEKSFDLELRHHSRAILVGLF